MTKWARLYIIGIFSVLYLPILYLIFFSFNKGNSMTHFEGFTLNHFKALLSDQRFMMILLQTFFLAFLSSLIATAIALFGVFYLRQIKVNIKERYLFLNHVLLVSPDVMIGASFLLLFTVVGFQLGFVSVLLSHIAFSIPIVVLMLLPQVEQMEDKMVEAAYDLGANGFQVAVEVILPYMTPAIISGYFMAFTYSLDDFAVSFFVTGNGFSTLAVEIYSRARRGISLEINALSSLIFIVSLVLTVGYYFVTRERQAKDA